MTLRIALDLRPIQAQSSHARRGIGRWLSEFVLALAEKDTQSEYVILWEGWTTPPQWFERQTVLHLPQKVPGVRWLSDFLLTPMYVRFTQADVYFTADFMAYPYGPAGADTVLLSLVHDFMPLTLPGYKWRTRLGGRLNFNNLRTHDHVFVTSDYTLKQAGQYLKQPLPQMSKMGVGVNRKRFFPAPPEEICQAQARWGLQDYLIYVGAPNARKNLVRLIQAVDALPEELPLILVGDELPESKQLLEAIKRAKHPERIKLLGFLQDEELVCLLSGAVAMVFPSLAEGFGLPVLEAMACGTPVITSNCSALPEAAGNAAMLIDPLSPTEIMEAILRIRHQPAFRQELIEAGLQRVQAFSWESCAEIFLDHAQQLVQTRATSGQRSRRRFFLKSS